MLRGTLIVAQLPQEPCMLAERHPQSGLAAASGSKDRAAWPGQMVYLANSVLPAMRGWLYADIDGNVGE